MLDFMHFSSFCICSTNNSDLTVTHCVVISGYGAQAGPSNEQQMKGNGTNQVFSVVQTKIKVNKSKISSVVYVTGYGVQAGGYGGQGTKGNGTLRSVNIQCEDEM